MASNKVLCTKNYALFTHSGKNRPLEPWKHGALRESMVQLGFIPSQPAEVYRVPAHKLYVVHNGQHRIHFAEELDLEVYYMEIDDPYPLSIVNTTTKNWTPDNYAQMHATQNVPDYQESLNFAHTNGFNVGAAFAMLAGFSTYKHVKDAVQNGTYRIGDRAWADDVANLYRRLLDIKPSLKNAQLVNACMAVCRVEWFSINKLIANAQKCGELLLSYSDRDGNLNMLDEVYNFSKKTKREPLKTDALNAMRERTATERVRLQKEKTGVAASGKGK